MEHNNEQQLKEQVMQAIKVRRIAMHPKYYFVLKLLALVGVSVVALLVSIFIFNFILFSIRINSQESFLAFGPRGWGAFLYFFPWSLLGLDIILVILLVTLLRKFSFGYKTPVLFVVGGLVVLTALIATIIDRGTGINDHILRDADARRLPPPINNVYGGVRHMPPPNSGFCKACTVLSVAENSITVVDSRASTTPITVTLPPNDPRATTSGIEVGDTVFVAGDREGDTIRAFGIRELPLR